LGLKFLVLFLFGEQPIFFHFGELAAHVELLLEPILSPLIHTISSQHIAPIHYGHADILAVSRRLTEAPGAKNGVHTATGAAVAHKVSNQVGIDLAKGERKGSAEDHKGVAGKVPVGEIIDEFVGSWRYCFLYTNVQWDALKIGRFCFGYTL